MSIAIVTGCSRGIGAAVTEMLLADDWSVIGLSRTAPVPRDGLYWFSCDVGVSAPIGDILAANDLDTVDALVHCAGVRGPYGRFLDNDPTAWAKTIATNLIGTANVVRAALPALQRSDDGRILLFSGGGAFSPEPGYSAYAATKGGTIALMETLAEELRGTSVTVNGVAPGFVATSIHAGTPHEGKSDGGEAMSRAVACVRHLLSPEARGLNGRTVSAQWDDWSHLDQSIMPRVMDSHAGKRTRHKLQMLETASRHPSAVLACPVGATA